MKILIQKRLSNKKIIPIFDFDFDFTEAKLFTFDKAIILELSKKAKRKTKKVSV